MSRFVISLLGASLFAFSANAADSPLTQEVHELRRDVQMQAKKIDTLKEQVAQLTEAIAEQNRMAHAALPIPAPAPRENVKTASAPPAEIPKAEAVAPAAPMAQHVVEKGETLTSIAKRYNIPLSDLQKINKITNDRKLQIGQTLSIPAPKSPEAPADKKETP